MVGSKSLCTEADCTGMGSKSLCTEANCTGMGSARSHWVSRPLSTHILNVEVDKVVCENVRNVSTITVFPNFSSFLSSLVRYTSSTMRNNPHPTVPLHPSLGKRLYETTVLLSSFKTCFPDHHPKRGGAADSESRSSFHREMKSTFFRFLNKLGQICDDHQRSGTAFAVLYPSTVRYYFASNDRDTEALERVRNYVIDVLGTIGNASDEAVISAAPDSVLFSEILFRVLRFNCTKIKKYAKVLTRELDFYIKVAGSVGATEGNPSFPLQAVHRI